MSKVEKLNDASFQEQVKSSDQPYLVDFWATWCGPCIAIAPIIDKIAEEYEGKLKVAKLDVDENRDTAVEFGVVSIPTLIFFKNGKEVNRIVGGTTKRHLDTEIAKVI